MGLYLRRSSWRVLQTPLAAAECHPGPPLQQPGPGSTPCRGNGTVCVCWAYGGMLGGGGGGGTQRVC
jgi:hypothetical protein